MVQRKAHDRHGSQFESKKNHVKSDKRLSSHQHQDIRNMGGSDLKKKMKKARSIRVSDLERIGSPPRGQYIQFDKARPQKKPPPAGISGGSPNYMKSTSSSDARKEKRQVTVHSPTTATDKNWTPKNSSSAAVAAAPGFKPAKALTRKSSLKPVTPWKKRSSGIPLYPKINVSRNTCSSTLKNSKFPNYLHINPGGTESEGTSVLKVCPYTYCSLNGHRHAPLPPLKCFLSARRRLLKTQKSMKLKELSSFRKRGSWKDEMEVDTGQTELDREVGDDFFVEIYANKSQAEIAASEGCVQEEDDAVHPDFIDEISWFWDGEKSSKTRIEDGRKDIKSLDDESASEINSDENLDQSSEHYVSETELLTNFLACDHEVESRDMEDPPCLVQDYLEGNYECCILIDSHKICGGLGESKGKESVSEASDMDCGEDNVRCFNDEVECSGFPHDDSSDGLSLQTDINDIPCEEAASDAIATAQHEGCEWHIEETYTEPFSGAGFDGEDVEPAEEDESSKVDCMVEASDITVRVTQNEPADVSDQNCRLVELEASKEYDHDDVLEIEIFCSSLVFLGIEGASEEPTGGSNPTSENLQGDALQKGNNKEEVDDMFEDLASESVEPRTEENMITTNTRQDDAFLGDKIDENNMNDEVDGDNRFPETQVSSSHGALTPTDKDTAEKYDLETEIELEVPIFADVTEDASLPPEIQDQPDIENSKNQKKPEKDQHKEFSKEETGESRTEKEDNIHISDDMQVENDDESDAAADEACLVAILKCTEEDTSMISAATTNSNQLNPDSSKNLRARANNVRRKKTDKDLEELKAFNPRAPNFLPIEPDPEGEKVDLRHQMMDERKNAEEWMIDYALRQAVTKLAPARKRKVALLVEAFETVKPVPTYEAPLRHATDGFGHARPMQACS